jgi:hypothetical protein
MSIEVKEIKEVVQTEYTAMTEADGWSEAFDSIMHGDFTGLSTVLMIVVGLILLRPILALLPYIVSIWVVFMMVKMYG